MRLRVWARIDPERLARPDAPRASRPQSTVAEQPGSGLTGRSLARPIGTITTKNRWGVVDGERMRMLAAEETRGFMGFPEGYRLPAGVTEATFMLGNAVCPPVARDVINAIREAA